MIDHVTKQEIGEMEYTHFRVDETFRIPFKDGSVKYYLVTGLDGGGEGKVYLFELMKKQYDQGLRIRDVLI